MTTPVLQQIINEVGARLSTIPDTTHLGFYAGDMPQEKATAFGKPVQDAEEGEAGFERFTLELSIGLRAVDEESDNNHMVRLIALYGEAKAAIFGDDGNDIDLGGLAELVLEAGFSTETGFDMATLEADGVFTLRIQYSTELGNPFMSAN